MPSAAPRANFRADIQGLRAVAVVLVVLDHVFHWPSGGFFGVDVFYVISGFLITGLLLRELDTTGSISLRSFYARRIRRIVPVAIVVLVITTLAAFLFWYLPRALQVALDALSAAMFSANWHFMSIGTDYLQADGPVSPVQHYWSLAVEEQFYAVWPLLLLLASFMLKTRREFVIVIAFGLLGSLVIAWRLTNADPTPAYFNTFARGWELLAGALLAAVGVATERVSQKMRYAVSALGLLLIVGSSILMDESWKIPFPWVAPAVVGAGLVIWAAAPVGKFSLLGNPVSQWLGNVSYSLYLWHFPVLIFGISLIGDSPGALVLLIGVMLILSELSYRYVERAFMKSSILRKASKLRNVRRFMVRDFAVGVVALGLIVAFGMLQTDGPRSLQAGSSFTTKYLERQPFIVGDLTRDERTRQDDVIAAADASTWPDGIDYELTWLDAEKLPGSMSTAAPGCRNFTTSAAPPLVCDLADGDAGTAMLMGDSVAIAWSPALQHVAEQNGWSLSAVGYTNCSLFDVSARNNANTPNFANECEKRRETMFKMIASEKPDAVFLSASETVIPYMDMPLPEAQREWQAGVERTLERLKSVPSVYILTNPPLTEDPLECANKVVGPDSCKTPVSDDFRAKSTAEAAAVERFPNAQLIDTESWFCADGMCPIYAGDHIMKTDTSHLTKVTGRVLGPVLLDAIS